MPWRLRGVFARSQKTGDRGSLARASGDYAIVVAHNPDAGITRIKLPSGTKKVNVSISIPACYGQVVLGCSSRLWSRGSSIGSHRRAGTPQRSTQGAGLWWFSLCRGDDEPV